MALIPAVRQPTAVDLLRTDEAIVYEIEASLDPAIAADYDAWLPDHARAVLESPGFLSVELLRPTDGQPGDRVRRISRYRVRDRGALEAYVETRAPALREDAAQRFGDRARFERRVLAPGQRIAAAGVEQHCANCGAVLRGPWCAACGQRARESARSLGTLFHDAWHVFTHVDGTLWRTLRGLLLKPGFLTNEYFRDRRASYIPPFRLYLVISLLFFGFASLTDSFQANAPIEIADEPSSAADRARAAEAAEKLSEAQRELQAAGAPAAISGAVGAAARGAQEAAGRTRVPADGSTASAPAAEAPATNTPPAGPQTATTDAARPAVTVVPRDAPVAGTVRVEPVAGGPGFRIPSEQCATLVIEPAWLEGPLRRACERATADRGQTLARSFAANIPKMMFVFLPLMAAVMLLLYWRPRRYYVEHLVFYLHVHAAIFLVLTLLVLLGELADAVPLLAMTVAIGGPAVFFYSTWYVWRAMRAHYRDGRALTLAKFVVIAFVYVVSLGMTLVGTALVSALTA